MTSYDPIPMCPPSIGEVIGDTSAYQAWALSFPGPAPGPRIRRPGRIRRKVATLAAVAVAAGLALAGCSAGAPVARASVRPVWDGRHPAVWTNPRDPMCFAKIEHRHSVVRVGGSGPVFRAECQRDGSEFAWGIVSGGAR